METLVSLFSFLEKEFLIVFIFEFLDLRFKLYQRNSQENFKNLKFCLKLFSKKKFEILTKSQKA